MNINYHVVSEYEYNYLFPNTAFINKMNRIYHDKYINSQPLLKFEYEMMEYRAKKVFFNDKYKTWGIEH